MQTGKIPYGRQTVEKDDIAAVTETLKSDFLTQGPKVPQFEETVSSYCGAKFACAVNSGTSALHVAYLALGGSAFNDFFIGHQGSRCGNIGAVRA